VPIIKSYRIFVSHAFKVSEDYARLSEMIDSSFSLPYSLSSVPADMKYRKMNKLALEGELRRQIAQANCFVALDSLYQADDGWARYELEYAVKTGKPILAIRERKSKDLSSILENASDEVLGWNQEAIMASIQRISANALPGFLH
jgi:nucleoside 2-deoxyribosyltransferase